MIALLKSDVGSPEKLVLNQGTFFTKLCEPEQLNSKVFLITFFPEVYFLTHEKMVKKLPPLLLEVLHSKWYERGLMWHM